MKKILLLIFTIQLTTIAIGQSQSFIDSLSSDVNNKVIVFTHSCVGCIVIKAPCEEYINSGNPSDEFVIWQNKKGFHIKKFNVCGSSKTVRFKKWKNDPFEFILSNSYELDTAEIRYPLSLNNRDSSWFETDINHYKYYEFFFPTFETDQIIVKDYAFREPSEEDRLWNENEYKKNYPRYTLNNNSEIKELLDIISAKVNMLNKKLVIIK